LPDIYREGIGSGRGKRGGGRPETWQRGGIVRGKNGKRACRVVRWGVNYLI